MRQTRRPSQVEVEEQRARQLPTSVPAKKCTVSLGDPEKPETRNQKPETRKSENQKPLRSFPWKICASLSPQSQPIHQLYRIGLDGIGLDGIGFRLWAMGYGLGWGRALVVPWEAGIGNREPGSGWWGTWIGAGTRAGQGRAGASAMAIP